MTADTTAAPAARAPDSAVSISGISQGYRGYAMCLLVALYIVNHLDRQVVNILAEPIKRDLGLADWQLGLMTGLAFAVLYTFLGIPIARIAERGHRPYIIAVAAAVWSAFTMLCGMAQNFTQLVLARIGVGIGEAGCTPPAHSLIVDYNPPEKRSSALAFYGIGAPLGALTGMAFGGLIADAYGWRTAFLLAGAPGILLAVLAALTLKEPRRMQGGRAAAALAETPKVTFGDTLRLLKGKRSFWFVAFGSAIKALVLYGKGAFIASFFLRNHTAEVAATAESVGRAIGVNLQPIGFLGITLGLLAGVGGALGMWSGGQLGDRFGARDPRNYLKVAAIGSLLTVPAFFGALVSPSIGLAFALIGAHAYFGGYSYGPTYGVALGVTPPHMRATASALMLFAGNLIGLGLGPLAVGLTSDLFARTAGAGEGLRSALLVFAFIGLLPTVLYWLGTRTVREDLKQA